MLIHYDVVIVLPENTKDPVTDLERERYLQLAEKEAEISERQGGKKSAAILVKNGAVVAAGHDRSVQLDDPVAVAVADCFRNAGRRNDHAQLDLYCSPPPDMLGAGVMIQFGVAILVVRKTTDNSAVLQFIDSNNIPVVSLETDSEKQL